jgi:hypothetical protein
MSPDVPVPAAAPDPKPWYRSTTIIGLLAVALVAAHAHFDWSWLPPDEAAAEHVAEGLVGIAGAVLALRGRAKATQPVSLNLDLGKILGVSTAAGVLLFAGGCQALGLRTGTDPNAQAPAYSGVGVLVLGAGNDLQRAVSGVRLDQSGATGASGQASSSAEQSQTTEIGAEAVSALLDAAQAALAGGNPAAAQGILGAAQQIGGAKKDKPATTTATPTTRETALATAAAAAARATAPATAPGATAPAPPTKKDDTKPADAAPASQPANTSPPSGSATGG